MKNQVNSIQFLKMSLLLARHQGEFDGDSEEQCFCPGARRQVI
jgi:hypothetical protein